MPDRGMKQADLAVCRETVMPACLLECGFIDSADANQLKDTGFLNGLAEAIVRGVCKAHNVAYVAPAPAQPPQTSSGFWTVQVGAFRDRGNADRLAAELKAKGYDVFVKKLNELEIVRFPGLSRGFFCKQKPGIPGYFCIVSMIFCTFSLVSGRFSAYSINASSSSSACAFSATKAHVRRNSKNSSENRKDVGFATSVTS